VSEQADRVTRTELDRIEAHRLDDNGEVHCVDECAGRGVPSPIGLMIEIRCPHWRDPLRYDPVEPERAADARSLMTDG
jgi:hypothetical protein